MPAGASRDAAVAAYIGRLTGSLPELAAPWAESLSDETARFNQIENVARAWLDTDRTAAETWLAGSKLPDERKKQLLAAKPEENQWHEGRRKRPRVPAVRRAKNKFVPTPVPDDPVPRTELWFDPSHEVRCAIMRD